MRKMEPSAMEALSYQLSTAAKTPIRRSRRLGTGGRWTGSRHLAAARGIGERLGGDAHVLVLEPLGLAQIDVLDRVVRLGERELAARTVDGRLLHGGDQGVACTDIALDGAETGDQELAGVVALHGVDVGVAVDRALESCSEALVLGDVEAVGIVHRGLEPLRRLSLGLERAVREEARTDQRDGLAQARREVVLHEAHGAAAREEGVDDVGLDRADLRQQGLELDLREGQIKLALYLAAAGL